MVKEQLMYQDLPDINEVEPLSDSDGACIEEIRKVLERHGRLKRFGIMLLHKHFDVANNEVLVETCNSRMRTLTMQPAIKSDKSTRRAVETSWRLDLQDATTRCKTICLTQCSYDRNGNHTDNTYHKAAHY
jgi:hypothetical protein